MALETENIQLEPVVLTNGVTRLFDEPERGVYFVAEINGTTVGSLMITFEWSDWRNMDIIWLQSVYVLPEYRKYGVFSALLDAVEAFAAKTCSGLIRLYAKTNNITAHTVYRKKGFSDGHYAVWEKVTPDG